MAKTTFWQLSVKHNLPGIEVGGVQLTKLQGRVFFHVKGETQTHCLSLSKTQVWKIKDTTPGFLSRGLYLHRSPPYRVCCVSGFRLRGGEQEPAPRRCGMVIHLSKKKSKQL